LEQFEWHVLASPLPIAFAFMRSPSSAWPFPCLWIIGNGKKGEKEMAEDSVERELMGAEETTGEVRLWQAVVVRAIEDWMSGPLRQKCQAEHYIFDDNTDFAMACQSAGLNADDLRARLTRIRGRHLHQEKAIAA
jgi:hypothetical protein